MATEKRHIYFVYFYWLYGIAMQPVEAIDKTEVRSKMNKYYAKFPIIRQIERACMPITNKQKARLI